MGTLVNAERGVKAAQMGHLVTSFRNGPRGKPSRAFRQMITRLKADNHLPLAKSKCKVFVTYHKTTALATHSEVTSAV